MTYSMRRLSTHVAIAIAATSIGFSQGAVAEDTNDGQRYVNQVMWDKSGAEAVDVIKNKQIPANQSNMVFIRTPDTNDVQTSVNIGIDGRFQTSLQGGHYSQVQTCAGSRKINLTTTGKKNNDLSRNSKTMDMLPNQSYYFRIQVEESTGALVLSAINEQAARTLLNGLAEQTHQISRVQANCQAFQPVIQPPPPVTQAPQPLLAPVYEPAPPVTPDVKMNDPIELDVLFEFDSSVVPASYNQRIQEVAMLLRDYPNVTVLVEGHTDSKGSASYNMGLSMRRAQAVKNELVNRYGADASRITTTGFGETRPIGSNATPQGRQNNRRVVAIISEMSNR